jgi:hypothetical protein
MSPLYPPERIEAPLVLPIVGWLSADPELAKKALEMLWPILGPVAKRGPVRPFDWTDYYEKEHGGGLVRQYVAFGELVEPTDLVQLKHETAKIEKRFAEGTDRKVNLDPGYLDINKLVLASWKEGLYKLYVGRGVWADPVAHYYEKGFHPPEWTFPDIRSGEHFEFFRWARGLLKRLRREGRGRDSPS